MTDKEFPKSDPVLEEIVEKFCATKRLGDDDAYTANARAQFAGITKQQCIHYYNRAAKLGLYEEYLNRQRFRGPKIAALSVASFFPEVESRPSKLVLDVAAGTGFLGQELYQSGFTKLHALDPSEGMLHVARQKAVYEKTFCCFLDHNRLPIDDDEYDCAVTSGGMCEGHIPVVGLYELARIVKPGGLVSLVIREDYLQTVEEYRDGLEDLMARMVEKGIWKQLSRRVENNYHFNHNGVVFEFVIC